jgi:photosystem II stability/assembly factor-like uncharacterized protein
MLLTKLNFLLPCVFFVQVLLIQPAQAQWKLVGGLTGGHFIDITQGENGTVYAATTSGVYRSSDHGVTWSETDSLFPTGDVSALTVIGNRITVYTLHDGKFYSTDEGKHWAPVEKQGSDNQTFFVMEGKNGEVIAQGYRISSRSTDGGETWSDGQNLPKGNTPALITGDGVILSAGKFGSNGIERSTDHGITWSDPDTSLGYVRLIGRKNDSCIVVISAKGVYITNDEGNHWVQTATVLPTVDYEFRDMVTGSSGDLFFCTIKGIYKTPDYGKTWISVNNGLANTYIQTLLIDNAGVLYAASYGGGVFTSSDNGVTWVTPLSGPQGTTVFSMAANNAGEILAGAFQDGIFRSYENGTQLKRSGNGLAPNITTVSFVSNSANEIFAATDSGIFRSTNNGESWAPLQSGKSIFKKVRRIVVSGCGNILCVTDDSVLCSVDNGVSWITPNHGQDFPTVTSLTSDGDSILYASTVTGVLRSSNAGLNWVATGLGLPRNIFIRSIAVTVNHIVLAVTQKQGIYRSVDSGAHWVKTGGELTDSLNFTVIQTDSNGNCFAGAYGGPLIQSTDDGVNWKRIDSGLPRATIFSLAISGSHLFAGTEEKGIWYRSLSEITAIRNDKITSKKYQSVEPVTISAFQNGFPLVVTFIVTTDQSVECSVFSLSGSKIASLANRRFTSGVHRIVWNPNYCVDGCFIIKTRIGNVTSKKVITMFR